MSALKSLFAIFVAIGAVTGCVLDDQPVAVEAATPLDNGATAEALADATPPPAPLPAPGATDLMIMPRPEGVPLALASDPPVAVNANYQIFSDPVTFDPRNASASSVCGVRWTKDNVHRVSVACSLYSLNVDGSNLIVEARFNDTQPIQTALVEMRGLVEARPCNDQRNYLVWTCGTAFSVLKNQWDPWFCSFTSAHLYYSSLNCGL
jgi:hypothetical protein